MLQEELTLDLRHLAAELDELGENENSHVPSFPSIHDFEPVSLLGIGGMGAVYVARQISLGRDVAVKVVPSRGTLPEEARTVAQLHHPNIVQVYSAGGDAEAAWFAMELVNGDSADRHKFSSIEDVARLGIAAAEALAYAHRCGILHRDVKPSNIFVGESGMVKLGDFGLSCLASKGVKDKSGTERYMAPEVLNGDGASEASDQYSLGVTLRELAERIGPPSSDFAAICAKAAAHDPLDRYERVDALLADLHRFLAREPVVANPPSPLRRFRLFARRNPLAASGIVATAFLLAAFVAALAVGYVRTTRALAETERARAETEKALSETHLEAAKAAESLAVALTSAERAIEADPRAAELERAIKIAESLLARFPDDKTIKAAVKRLHYARMRHAELPSRPRRRPKSDRADR